MFGERRPLFCKQTPLFKVPEKQNTLPAKLPRGLDTTGFVVDSIVSRLVKKQAKNAIFLM
ncbi:hypothetical protein EH2_03398 [Bacillus subtilis]|nr:hypothetical protein EH2_03398 [Bacillus subtilis]